MDNQKQIHLLDLSSLKTDNVAQVYTKNFSVWRYENSDAVTLNGEPIEPGIERGLMRWPNKDGEPNLKGELIVSDTKDGFPLKEMHFIEQEIRKYKPLFEKSMGSKLNQTQHAKLEIYLNYIYNKELELKNKEQETNKPQQLEEPSIKYVANAYALMWVHLVKVERKEPITTKNCEKWGFTGRTLYSKYKSMEKDYTTIHELSGNLKSDNTRKKTLEQCKELLKVETEKLATINAFDGIIKKFTNKYYTKHTKR